MSCFAHLMYLLLSPLQLRQLCIYLALACYEYNKLGHKSVANVAVQSRKAVSAYFRSNQTLPFGFAEQNGDPRNHPDISLSSVVFKYIACQCCSLHGNNTLNTLKITWGVVRPWKSTSV